jgi:hypothetical protein
MGACWMRRDWLACAVVSSNTVLGLDEAQWVVDGRAVFRAARYGVRRMVWLWVE